jgi:CBS domain-containing protein
VNVREIMSTDLVVATPDMPLSQAARLLVENRITGLPVIDRGQHIVGVITERDLIRTVAEPHESWHTVEQLMTRAPYTVHVDAPIHEVFDCLMTHSFRRVLVEDGGCLVGVVSRTDLMPEILAHLIEGGH